MFLSKEEKRKIKNDREKEEAKARRDRLRYDILEILSEEDEPEPEPRSFVRFTMDGEYPSIKRQIALIASNYMKKKL